MRISNNRDSVFLTSASSLEIGNIAEHTPEATQNWWIPQNQFASDDPAPWCILSDWLEMTCSAQ
jgi:hypothetical protein